MFNKIHVFRVRPGLDLSDEIMAYCHRHAISSGIVLGIIGSLSNASLGYIKKLPGKYETFNYEGPLEIVAAQGSIARSENSVNAHIHVQLSSPERCYGGHLYNSNVFSTAEVVIGELDFQLKRELDSFTGLNEIID